MHKIDTTTHSPSPFIASQTPPPHALPSRPPVDTLSSYTKAEQNTEINCFVKCCCGILRCICRFLKGICCYFCQKPKEQGSPVKETPVPKLLLSKIQKEKPQNGQTISAYKKARDEWQSAAKRDGQESPTSTNLLKKEIQKHQQLATTLADEIVLATYPTPKETILKASEDKVNFDRAWFALADELSGRKNPDIQNLSALIRFIKNFQAS
jgi:hypothetical protein